MMDVGRYCGLISPIYREGLCGNECAVSLGADWLTLLLCLALKTYDKCRARERTADCVRCWMGPAWDNSSRIIWPIRSGIASLCQWYISSESTHDDYRLT